MPFGESIMRNGFNWITQFKALTKFTGAPMLFGWVIW